MDKNIKISVVIPVYNTEEFLGACLDSLFLQKYRDVEYILVDDGSKDGSLALCQKYAEKDERFVVIHKENGGPSSARNLAIEKARGEYVTFCDSDDFLRTDAYTVIAEKLKKHGDPDCLIFGANLVPEYASEHLYNLVTTRDKVYEKFTPEMLYNEVGTRPFLWLQVIKRSLIVDNGIKMDESISLGEDQLFQIEVFPFSKKTVFISDKLYFYRWNRQGSLMSLSAENRLKKLLLHVGLVEKAFATIYTDKYSDDMKRETLVWSIFFLWGDIIDLLEEDQNTVAAALCKVWEKYDYETYLEKVDIWGKARLEHIKLMAIEDKDARIEAFDEANTALAEEIEKYKKLPEYAKVEKIINGKKTLLGKAMRSLKENGFKETVRKAKKKLSKK